MPINPYWATSSRTSRDGAELGPLGIYNLVVSVLKRDSETAPVESLKQVIARALF